MRDPWELYYRDFVTTERKIPPIVRYLRADLTCGECALCNWLPEWGAPECPHVYDNGGWRPDERTPACMAFVPKEQR